VENSKEKYKAVYRVRSKKGCGEVEPFFCFDKFKYFQVPPTISQKALKKKILFANASALRSNRK